MINKIKLCQYGTQLGLFMVIVLILSIGCNEQTEKTDKDFTADNSYKTADMIEITKINKYYPLTSDVLNGIRNGNSGFSALKILYGTKTNVYDHLNLAMSYGNQSGDFLLPNVSEFKGGFYEVIEESGSLTENSGEHVFTLNDINMLFNFISSPENSTYFFNAEEYEGQNIPYLSGSVCPPHKKYNFSLIFWKPQTWPNGEAWAIFKCVDEYPEEGTPLYGLFQMLENDFITQFEE